MSTLDSYCYDVLQHPLCAKDIAFFGSELWPASQDLFHEALLAAPAREVHLNSKLLDISTL